VQPFDFPFFEEFGSTFQQTAPTPTTYVAGETYDLMDFSGDGDVTAAVVNVDLNLTRRAPPPPAARQRTSRRRGGKIALLRRGTCPFGTKVANAEAAGAVGAPATATSTGTPGGSRQPREATTTRRAGGPTAGPPVMILPLQGLWSSMAGNRRVRLPNYRPDGR
jgi:PA domain